MVTWIPKEWTRKPAESNKEGGKKDSIAAGFLTCYAPQNIKFTSECEALKECMFDSLDMK
jgi:hypothetical protein